MQFLTAKDRQD